VTPEDWARLREHFEHLCEQAPESQQEIIDSLDEPLALREQLQRMLRADAESRLQELASEQLPSLHGMVGSDELAIPKRDGERLGAWRITGSLGAGGMGQVYRARRDDGHFEADAAIKIVSRDVNAAQFVHERSVLARLQHPHIARLLDGGECVDGRPYLVMELVRGKAIDHYCKERSCDSAVIIRLMLDAARAVAYAHVRAVLHRDIKPDNIMVDEQGLVKLLDFGVAKLLDVEHDGKLTVAECFTPRYAAPEQISRQAVTTASDVFSLAVVLYELVSGRHPFAAGDDAGGLARRILTSEATPLRRAMRGTRREPSSLTPPLRDLEAVLARALQSDASRRYQDMNAFVDELQRISEDRPVQTRHPGTIEKSLRWAARNRVAALGLVLGVASMLIGSGIALWQAHEASLQRDAAVIEAHRAERVATFLSDVFRAPDPSRSRGEEVSARELLDRSRERITSELADDPLLRQRLQAVMANTYRSLGLFDEAEALLLGALEQAGTEPEPELLSTLGWLHAFQGRFEDSIARLRQAERRAAATGDVPAQISALGRLATPYLNLGDTENAEAVIRESLALAAASGIDDRQHAIAMYGMLANIAFTRGDLDQAELQYQQILKLHLAEHGQTHVDVAQDQSNLATVAFQRGDWPTAERLYRRAIEINRAYFGVENAQIASQTRSLALTLRRSGHFSESLTTFRAAADMSANWNGQEHPSTTSTRLEALELALLMGEGSPAELAQLESVVKSLDADSLLACRHVGLSQWNLTNPDLPAISQSRDCLERLGASEANLAMAEVAVARAHDANGIASTDAWQRARESVEAMKLPDPLLLKTIERHPLDSAK
jgi:eukaryotic-like serine/threonine-protein kinase